MVGFQVAAKNTEDRSVWFCRFRSKSWAGKLAFPWSFSWRGGGEVPWALSWKRCISKSVGWKRL
jgi:hypothetical protein